MGGGPDGRVWGIDVNTGKLFATTTTGVTTQYPGNASNVANAFAVGADGNIYASYAGPSTIDIITPSTGALISLPASYAPQGVAAGADGNVWFTEDGASVGVVGNYSPAHVLTEYTITTPASAAPAGIATGPAGTMWFCDNSPITGTGEIDSVTLSSGAINKIVSLSTNCSNVTMQSDGLALWALSTTANQVFRVPTTSPYTPITVALSGTPVSMAAGADNAIYITETGGATGWVARISNTAAAPYTPNEIVVPHGFPTGIALGADGRMWYGENSVNMIGALSP